MTLRKVIFWMHLLAGVVAGIVIGIMSFTGAAIAFEKEIIAWAEREARTVPAPSSNASPRPLDDLLAKVKEANPEARPTAITLRNDPQAAVTVAIGREATMYANPYTGEVREGGAQGWRTFMHVMTDWHRYVGAHGENRNTGKAITGACNIAFLVLAVSGLYLWWPRSWSMRSLKAVTTFDGRLRGKARDWNWHNVIGFWTLPVIIVLTTTATVISYRWANNLVYRVTGTEPPPAPGAAAVEVPQPPPGAKRLGYDALVVAAREQVPQWDQITLRLGGSPARGATGGGNSRPSGSQAAASTEPASERSGTGTERSQREGGERNSGERGGERGNAPQPVTLTIREKGAWPLFASTQLTLDPFTANVLRKETFADYNLGRKTRSWMRFLHTGEALGKPGQAVAGVASLGGVVLVWTGFALAFRRFLAWRRKGKGAANPPLANEPAAGQVS